MSFVQNFFFTFCIFLVISYFHGIRVLSAETKCGEVNPGGGATIGEGSKFPWHVGIYRLKERKYEYICGGSIITPVIVLTAAHYFTNELGTERYPAQEFYVAAGKYYRDYNAVDDKLAQRNQVLKYHIPPQYEGYHTNFAGDLAVLVLVKPFEMTIAVQPVCVDWDNKFEPLQPNSTGKAVGWHYPDENIKLKQFDTYFIDREACKYVFQSKWLTPDTFCTVYSNYYIMCKGFAGGGLVFEKNENNKQKFYIRGLLSGSDNNEGNCRKFLSTKISTYIDFIRNIVSMNADLLSDSSCPVIKIENGQFRVLGQGYIPGTPIPNYSLVELTCNVNYTLYPANPSVACYNGRWNIPIPQCKHMYSMVNLRHSYEDFTVTCPPRNSSLVDCEVDGIPEDCSQPLKEGTVVTSTCKQFYLQSGISKSLCYQGTWSNPLVKCVPECGVVSDGIPNIVNGIDIKRAEFPWHIGLYRFLEGKYEYQCGGSIISPSVIITAAHCFIDNTGFKHVPEQYFVGAGKFYSDYNSAEDMYAQKTQVKEYHIPEVYRGYPTSYEADLAVVVVKTAFQLSNVVQPVCVDWDNKYESHQLKRYNRGTVLGWGYIDPNGPQVSKELKQLNPLFIEKGQCLDEVPSNFQRWVLPDKFCAGFRNGSSACNGDSGGGLVFRGNSREKFYIRGIVSVGPVLKSALSQMRACDNFHYGVYTKISFYKDFIYNIYKNT